MQRVHTPRPAIRSAGAFLLLLLVALLQAAALQAAPPSRLVVLRIDGLQRIDETELRGALPLEEGQLVDSTTLAAGRDSLAHWLARQPFLPEARLQRWELSAASGGLQLQITMDEGRALHVASVSLRGPLAGRGQELRSSLATRAGELYRPELWQADLDRLVDRLAADGFPFASARTAAATLRETPDSLLIALTAELRPGARVRIDRLEFKGLKRTRASVARRALALRPGHWYSPREAERARRRLARSGWFARIGEPRIVRDFEGRYALLYEVEEGQAGQLSGAVGYVPVDAGGSGGLAGQFEASLVNLLGAGRSLDLDWRRDSGQLSSFSVHFREPFLFTTPLAAELQLAQEVADSFYVSTEMGADLSLRLGGEWQLSGGALRRRVAADSFAVGIDSSSYAGIELRAALQVDTRDHPTNPRRGGRYRIASSRLLSTATQAELVRSRLELAQALPLGRSWAFHLGLAAQHMLGEPQNIPRAEWVRLGGARTLRGHAERRYAAPRAAWSQLELRWLTGPASRLFALLDLALLDNAGGRSSASGYGVGLEQPTPAGLLSVAIALPRGEPLSAAVVHARLAASF